MSGSASGNGNGIPWKQSPYQFGDMSEFVNKTQDGKAFSDTYNKLHGQTIYNSDWGFTSSNNGRAPDFGYGNNQLGDLYNAFSQWKALQANQQSNWNKYVDLSNQNPGRQATILTGSASNKPILGG